MHINDETATGPEINPLPQQQDWKLPELGEQLDRRFLLRSVLGSGASGTVYGAIDTSVGQKVAIKLLRSDLRDAKSRERLRREVRASRPGHENVVTVYDLHEDGPHLYLSMELVEGQSLREVIHDDQTVPVALAIDVGRQVIAGLIHLHSKGLVHRDVKPGNILLGENGVVKLCDMGLARPVEAGVTVTETEMVVGTPDYMAPEQASGADLTPASDLYGLGLTLYQMLTGEVALKESTAMATFSRRQRERPPSIRKVRPDCPRWLDRLIRRMLEPDSRDRVTASAGLKAFESKRYVPKPKLRNIAALAVGGFFLAGGITGARLLTEKTTIQVDIGEASVAGRDSEGVETWRRDFEIPIYSEIQGDIDGDGVEEIVVVVQAGDNSFSRASTSDGPEVWVFRKDGDVLTHFQPESRINWPFEYAVEIDVWPNLIDIDHDGYAEIVLVGHHRNFFPAVIFVYWAEPDRWDYVLANSGYLLNVRAIPEFSGSGLRFLALNNRLGLMGFLGEVVFEKQGGPRILDVRQSGNEYEAIYCPPFGHLRKSPPYRLSDYVPLPPDSSAFLVTDALVRDRVDGGMDLISPDGEVLEIDRFWNADHRVNQGRDLRELRRRFIEDVARFAGYNLRVEFGWVELHRAHMVESYGPLLDEEAYRILLELSASRAFAKTGRVLQARDLLADTVRFSGAADVIYRLAHYEALLGNFDEAIGRLDSLRNSRRSATFGTRANFDGPHLALRVGIESFNRVAVDRAISALSMMGKDLGRVRVAEALRARARLWWDELQPEDLEAESYSYAPSGGAIAVLGRWRQGETRGNDVTAMDRFIERNPDAKYDGRLARAAALLGTERVPEALDALQILNQQLETPAREDFSLKQIRDLNRAMWVVALEADRQTTRALDEGRKLRPELTDDLLPAILIDEVLARSGR